MRTPSPLLLAAFGVFVGCLLDALIKGLSTEVHVLAITLWRFLFASVYALTIFIALKRPAPKLEAFRFHAMRGAVQVIAALAFFYSLTQLGLAEATVLGFTAALMIAPIAWIVLGERMKAASLIAALVGFAGAALAVLGKTQGAPPEGDRLAGVAAVMIAALAYAAAIVLLRLRTRSEDSLTIVMFSNVMPGVILTVIAAGVAVSGWGEAIRILPAGGEWLVLAVIGACGMGIWWMFTLAYARAPAQRLAPLEYTALIWASLLGWAFFEETPGWRLYAGAAVIIAACLIVAFESRFANRRKAGLPASDILD